MLNPRLEIFYEKIVCEDFVVLYNFTNITLLPKFEQAILSSTSKSFGVSKTSVLQSFCAWRISTSQKSITTRARKSIALFNLRKETLLGLKVTLRKKTLFSFLDKALIFTLPILTPKKNNFKEKKGDIFGKIKNDNRDETFTKQSLAVPCVQKQTKPILLTLPIFLKDKQNFSNEIDSLSEKNYHKDGKNEVFTSKIKNNLVNHLCLSPKIRNAAFIYKLKENWEKKENANFIIDFSPFDSSSENNYDHNCYFFKSKKKKTFLPLKKLSIKTKDKSKAFTTKKTKSIFTISDSSALSFPEISSLSTFFDFISGFSLTFSLKKSKLLQIFSVSREELIKKQLLSAFGCSKS